MDKFYDYLLNKSSINSASAAEEYYDAIEQQIKKEDEVKRKPIEQNEQIIKRINEINQSLEETRASLKELKRVIGEPIIIDWIIVVLTGGALFVAILQLILR